ncbi:hypothetical protein RB195_017603 [Necator americanus]|uniref:Uncharacterized protein n=1 Tax=Necator americanus TaxID=51031 RepID=A0ABR1C5Z0_NECAM
MIRARRSSVEKRAEMDEVTRAERARVDEQHKIDERTQTPAHHARAHGFRAAHALNAVVELSVERCELSTTIVHWPSLCSGGVLALRQSAEGKSSGDCPGIPHPLTIVLAN